jgi:hypothetical protein
MLALIGPNRTDLTHSQRHINLTAIPIVSGPYSQLVHLQHFS